VWLGLGDPASRTFGVALYANLGGTPEDWTDYFTSWVHP
jgi:hypothetical protein